MASWDDVQRVTASLPEVVVDGGEHPAWRVRKKSFVWDRPLRPADHRHLGAAAPAGPVLGVRVADEGAKQALLAGEGPVVFTTPHFDGYPAVLVDLEQADEQLLTELVVDAWLIQAPKRLAAAYLAAGES